MLAGRTKGKSPGSQPVYDRPSWVYLRLGGKTTFLICSVALMEHKVFPSGGDSAGCQ